MITIYGIPNCDIVKKSLAWFKNRKIAFEFHNFKTQELSEAKLLDWICKAGLDVVVNKKSTTFRDLPLQTKQDLLVANKAVKVMMAETSIIKRPIIESKKGLVIGFNELEYSNKFGT